jgi:hypothetical protein
MHTKYFSNIFFQNKGKKFFYLFLIHKYIHRKTPPQDPILYNGNYSILPHKLTHKTKNHPIYFILYNF